MKCMQNPQQRFIERSITLINAFGMYVCIVKFKFKKIKNTYIVCNSKV